MGDKPARVIAKVIANDVTCQLGIIYLKPRETRAIDIRKLRDEQKSGVHGGDPIPKNATDGSIIWNRLDDVPVAGRLLVIDRSGGIASNLDCCYCPCGVNYTSLSVSPSVYNLLLGTTEGLAASTLFTDRCGVRYRTDVTAYSTWTSRRVLRRI